MKKIGFKLVCAFAIFKCTIIACAPYFRIIVRYLTIYLHIKVKSYLENQKL